MNASSDPIADMLTRIRNAVAVNHDSVEVPFSKTKLALAELLQANGYVAGVKAGKTAKEPIVIALGGDGQKRQIREIERLSKPGRRTYVTSKQIPRVRRGHALIVLSTSQGLMSAKDARAQQLGGELMCMVY